MMRPGPVTGDTPGLVTSQCSGAAEPGWWRMVNNCAGGFLIQTLKSLSQINNSALACKAKNLCYFVFREILTLMDSCMMKQWGEWGLERLISSWLSSILTTLAGAVTSLLWQQQLSPPLETSWSVAPASSALRSSTPLLWTRRGSSSHQTRSWAGSCSSETWAETIINWLVFLSMKMALVVADITQRDSSHWTLKK